MSDIILTLGDIEFQDFEIPEEIAVPTRQSLKVHQRVGGKKTVDAMGAFVDPITWTGRFRGADAEDRRDAINAMVLAGQSVSLAWGARAFTVVVQAFTPGHRGNNEIPYTITCEVISDDADPNVGASGVDPNEMIGADVDAAQTASLGVVTGQSSLASAMASVQTAVGNVADFARATREEIASVVQPIVQARIVVGDLIASAESVLNGAVALGGVAPGLRGADMVSGLLGQISAMGDCADLYDAGAYLGRAEVNLDAIGSSGAHVIVAGGDLFQIATAAYGDATEWVTIAAANGLTDPALMGLQEITVPPSALGGGGILS